MKITGMRFVEAAGMIAVLIGAMKVSRKAGLTAYKSACMMRWACGFVRSEERELYEEEQK